MDRIRRCLSDIRTKAHELRDIFGDDGRAQTLEWAARYVETALTGDADELLSIRDAAHLSGYSVEHLARLVRDGTIPDARPAGRRGRLVIRTCDIPVKPGARYIGDAETHDLASRLLGGKEG